MKRTTLFLLALLLFVFAFDVQAQRRVRTRAVADTSVNATTGAVTPDTQFNLIAAANDTSFAIKLLSGEQPPDLIDIFHYTDEDDDSTYVIFKYWWSSDCSNYGELYSGNPAAIANRDTTIIEDAIVHRQFNPPPTAECLKLVFQSVVASGDTVNVTSDVVKTYNRN